MAKFKNFLKSEIVLVIAFILAVGSAFFVPPDLGYLEYVDLRTLSLLFCLMTVTAGLAKLGLFNNLSNSLLRHTKTSKSAIMMMTLICFFSSMLITNDVALITFVPFTLILLRLSNTETLMIPAVVLETVVANLGSSLTPIGNPQNLYLYSKFNLSLPEFLLTLLPYSALSLALIVVGCLLIKGTSLNHIRSVPSVQIDPKKLAVYIALFILAMLTVLHIIPYYILLLVTAAAVLIFDRKVFLKVDYSLLFTFAFLFVFIGNLGRIAPISQFLSNIIDGNEVPVAVLSSQAFSNVPAAILLSEFTTNAKDLLVGVNLGGLGTLIASMASLISFRFVAFECKRKGEGGQGKYLLWFTIVNVLFLAANMILWYFIK